MTKFVYLIESECGRIKVGSSAKPEIRLATFSTQSPRPLRLIAKWPGSIRDEQAIHRQFRAYRTHNEWFRAEGEFAEFVAAKRGSGLDQITDWEALTWAEKREHLRLSQSENMKAHWSDPDWRADQEAKRALQKRLRDAGRAIGRELTLEERGSLISSWGGASA